MSDTPDEKRDHSRAVSMAKGNVLIHGLGLGMVLNAMLIKPEVERVTVVEISDDVRDLVWPTYSENPKANLVMGSAFDWPLPKGERWDVVWHDIWPNMCADNLKGMERLARRFARRCDWQGFWGKEQIKRNLKRRGW